MYRLRFSTRDFFLGIVVLCACLAGIVANHQLATFAMLTALYAWLCLSVVASIVTRGPRRAFWLGSAVFGVAFGFTNDGSQWEKLVNSAAASHYQTVAGVLTRFGWSHNFGDHVYAQWNSGSYYWGTVIEANWLGDQYLIKWDDGSTPTYVMGSQIQFADRLSAGAIYVTVALLASVLGGALSLVCFGRGLDEPHGKELASAGDARSTLEQQASQSPFQDVPTKASETS